MPVPAGAFERIALVGRYASPGMAQPLARLAQFLGDRGHEVMLEAETAKQAPLGVPGIAAEDLGGRVDLAIVIGGDGTMLSIARRIAALDIPLIGINQGRLGFLTEVTANWPIRESRPFAWAIVLLASSSRQEPSRIQASNT